MASHSAAHPRLVKAKRASEELGVPYRTLLDAAARGELPAVRIGANERHSAVYFERKALDSWVDARTTRAEPSERA